MAKPTTRVGRAPAGRRPSTSHAELEQLALVIFAERGFDVTSVDEIAAAAGIGRRTFFRYYQSKNDIVWGDFDAQLDRFARWFDDCPADVPLVQAIRTGVIDFNSFHAEAAGSLKARMRVILNSPALQAYSTLRYAAWRAVIERFVARRLDLAATDLLPRVLGHLALGAALAAYEQWLADDGSDLVDLLQLSLSAISEPAGAR